MRSYVFRFAKSFLTSENLGEAIYNLTETVRTFNGHLKETFEIDTSDFRLSTSDRGTGDVFGVHVALDKVRSIIYVNKEILERLMENPYITDLSHLCWDILSATTGAQLYRYYKGDGLNIRFASSFINSLVLKKIGDDYLLEEAFDAKVISCEYLLENIKEDRELMSLLLTIDFTDVLIIMLARLIPKCIPIDHGRLFKSIKENEFEKLYDGLFSLIPNLEGIEIERINKIHKRVSEIIQNEL